MFAACLLCLAIAIPVYAVNAVVYADVVNTAGKTVTVPLSIHNNPGLMGFKLIVKYDNGILQPQTVTRGTVTQSGMMNDSIGAGESGTLLVVWSDTDAVKEDGTLAVLTFKANKQTDTTLTVSYSQPDTFDGSFADVKLDCKPVEIVFGGETRTTPSVTKTPDSHDIQVAVDSVEDKTDVPAVNEAIARLTGTEDLYSTPEEVQSAYSAAVAENFVETVLLTVDSKQIDTAIQNALQEVGAETVESIPLDKQETFVRRVETELQEEAPDVPTISEAVSAEEVVQVIETLQRRNEKAAKNGIPVLKSTDKQIGRPLVWFGVGATVIFAVAICIVLVYRGRKNEKKTK